MSSPWKTDLEGRRSGHPGSRMIPIIPKQATIRSALSAYVRLFELPSLLDGTSKAIGCRSDGDHSLGLNADLLSSRAFQAGLTCDQVLDEHSHFPLFSCLLEPGELRLMRKDVASGSRQGQAWVASVQRTDLVEGPTLRRCPSCVREDLATYGCGHWRTFHQWPAARHCVRHGDLLHTHCKNCKSPFVRLRKEQLACDACPSCGSRQSAGDPWNEPPGYWLLMRALEKTLNGRSLTHYAGIGFVSDLNRNIRDTSGPGHFGLVSDLLTAWRVGSMQELASVLGCHFDGRAFGGLAQFERWPKLLQIALIANAGLLFNLVPVDPRELH